MKPFLEILTDKSPVDKLKAEESIFHLYRSLNLPIEEFIWKQNLLGCVKYVCENHLIKTSIKQKFIEQLSIGENFNTTKYYRQGTTFNLYKDILNGLFIRSNIIIFPQLNLAGHNFLAAKTSLIESKYKAWFPIYDNISCFIPLENKCVISETRLQVYATNSTLRWTNEFDFHRAEGKPAISMVGTNRFDQFWLNNIRLPNKWFKVPPEKLNPQDILQVSNVEQRMELIRYVGMEQMLNNLPHRVIDKKEPYYELLHITLPIIRNIPRISSINRTFNIQELNCYYLKMVNPSTGTFHVEAVAPHCRTIQQALNWRAEQLIESNENWEPEQLT